MGRFICQIMEETWDFSDIVWKFPSGTFIFDQYNVITVPSTS